MMKAKQNRKRKHTLSWVLLIPVCVAVFVAWSFFWWFGIAKPALTSPPEASPEEKKEQRMQEVLAYLEERYGEEFEIASYRGMSYVHDYVQMYAYPKGFSDEAHQFQIQGRLDEDGNMEYTDSYVMVKLTDDYAVYVDQIIDEYFDDYKFFLEFNSEWITSNLPSDTKVEDLFELRANVDYPLPYLDIFFKSSQKENFTDENIMNMCRRLAVWGYRGPIYITWYDDDEYYEKKNNENKMECIGDEDLHWKNHAIFIRNDADIDYR
ncbi:MAG: hypothetical protein NC489_36605 [Ruminococcus flavefaciens]|nr:hypothetical protein [Ruminococcus flavefaciens]